MTRDDAPVSVPATGVGSDGRTAAWTWHVSPKAVEFDGATYWGVTVPVEEGRSGAVIVRLDHLRGTCTYSPILRVTGAADDHCNPSILVLPDGRLIAGVAGHTSDRLWYAISSTPGSVTNWAPTRELAPGRMTRFSYSQMVFLSDEGSTGRLYWFFRAGITSSRVWRRLLRVAGMVNCWAYTTSDDFGETWGPSRVLWREVGVSTPYTHVTSNGADTIYFSRSDTTSLTDPASRRHVLACVYRDGALYRLDGTRVCGESSLPVVDHRRLDLVYDSTGPEGRPAFNLDIALNDEGDPVIAFSILEPAPHHIYGLTNVYHIAEWSGRQWHVARVAEGGPGIAADGVHHHYSGGMALDRTRPGSVYVGVAGDCTTIQRWQLETADGRWRAAETLARQDVPEEKFLRPVCPDSSTGIVPVLWMGGRYNTYTDWETSVRWVSAAAAGLQGAGVEEQTQT